LPSESDLRGAPPNITKSAPKNVPEIGRQLGGAHILEGSVQKSGDAVRVECAVNQGRKCFPSLADTFDRKLTDVFSVESDVAKAIAETVASTSD